MNTHKSKSATSSALCQNSPSAPVGSCYEIELDLPSDNHSDLPLRGYVFFTLPNGEKRQVKGFATASGHVKARAYVNQTGYWKWAATSDNGAIIGEGSFQAIATPQLPGKLTVPISKPFAFAFSDGSSFLHFGDNALRFLVSSEKQWPAYLEQANQAGFSKIRTCLIDAHDPRGGVISPDEEHLNLDYWDEADHRLTYALDRYPKIQFELIPFANHPKLFSEYENGSPHIHTALRYTQERFSALPNVHWGSDDGLISSASHEIGKDLDRHEQWGSLISGSANDSPRPNWQTYMSIRMQADVSGIQILKSRIINKCPAAIGQVIGEYERLATNPRYLNRRILWGAVLSGGHACYQGLDTRSPFNNSRHGIQGYYDACHAGRLENGAHDILHMKRFLNEIAVNLSDWIPNDTLTGNRPFLAKSMQSPDAKQCIAYIANPDSIPVIVNNEPIHPATILNATPNQTLTTINLSLPFSHSHIHWFSPSLGTWQGSAATTKPNAILITPEPGDWVIYAHDCTSIQDPVHYVKLEE